MNLQELRDSFKDYSKDTKINLSNILTPDGAPGLNQAQIAGTVIACAHALESPALIAALEKELEPHLTDEIKFAARAAASIMAMNNVYYRFVHLAEEPKVSELPAKLRMTVIGRPGVDKVDFEVYCLAVSALNGCGNCIRSHVQEALKGGISAEGVQSAGRIAAVLAASRHAVFGAGFDT